MLKTTVSMNVRIRLNRGRPLQRWAETNRPAALAMGALLGPASLMPYALGLWRLASDIGLAGEFEPTGFFSHWQVWIGMGLAMNVAAVSLTRYGRGGQLEVPKVVS